MSELILTQADKGKSFGAYQNDVILIRLPENPTTGYRWVIDATNEEILQLEAADFALASDAEIGGGGERILRFRAKNAGTSHVELQLRREWEGAIPPIQRCDFTIRVE